MGKIIFIIGVIFLACLSICNGSQYTVIGGGKLRPFSDYTLAVSWSGDVSSNILLEITNPRQQFREAQQLTLEPDSTKVATFKIGSLKPGDYNLTISSTSGDEFSDSVSLKYDNKTYCVFLHTDKTVYQPGEIIHFRLLVLNMFLKSLFTAKPQVLLKDGRGNVVKKWANVALNKGVFSDEIQVAEFPVYGDWIFEIELNDQLYTKKVLVADFVLPKFLVHIDAPKHIYFKDEKFPVSVRAEQLTGQNIIGELTLSVYPVFFSGVIQPIFQAPVRKVMQIDGYTDVEFKIKDELGLTEVEGNERSIIVEAAIEETLTGRRHNVSSLIHLHRTTHAISYNIPSYYKSNMPFVVQLKASMWENENFLKAKPAQIRYSFSGEGEDKTINVLEGDCWFNIEGNCQHTYYPQPVSNQSLLDIEIRYMDIKEKITAIGSAYSPSKNHMQIQLMEPSPIVNGKVRVGINCTEPFNLFSYYVLGRGNIVTANTIQVVPARKVYEFEFHASQAMAPEATIIVTYTRESKEIVGDSFKFKVDGAFQNSVQLKIVPSDPEPLGNLDVTISATPNSYIALMAGAPSPDFSISTNHHYKAGEGSGLSPKEVLGELRSFSGYHDELRHPFQTIDGHVTMEMFKEAGVFLMTNNKVNGQYSSFYDTRRERVEGSTRPPLAGPYAFSHLPALPVPRLHLGRLPIPTWLFTNITLIGDGETTLGRRVSANAGGEWSVGAWAMHPTLGLGFASPIKANVRRRLLKASAPSQVKVGETVAVIANLFNPYYYALTADITLQNSNQEFRFEDLSNEVNSAPKLELYQRQKLNVAANRTSSVVFFITPTLKPSITGTTITLDINSSAKGATESLQLQLTIFPDGEEMIDQSSMLLDFDSGSVNVNLTLKNRTLFDNRRSNKISYEELQIGVTGSLLGPAIEIVSRFLELPPAGGYYNMLPFMASVVLLQHLENNQLPESIKLNGIDTMQKLYQQQMLYRQNDGSFSINAGQKKEGSIWVTGMTALWFGRALKISEVGVERVIINDALHWLSTKQSADGSFKESSTLPIDDPLQQNPVTLTALTLQTFLDSRSIVGDEYSNLISKAKDWLAKNIGRAADEKWDAGVLAPLAGVLHSADHPAATQATHLLNSIATASDGRRWWELSTVKSEMGNPWRKSGSRNVWVTAWGLQALLGQGYLSEALETAKTLVSLLTDWSDLAQSLPALPALINLSQKLPKETQATLEFYCPNDRSVFTVNKQNSLVLQKQQVRGNECKVTGNGQGVALSLLQGIRRTNVTGAWPRFTLDPRVDAISTPHRLQLSICMGFVPLVGEEMSGPVLLKLRLPSGFVADLDIPALLSGGLVRAAREVHSTKITSEPPLQMILSPMKASERCLTIKASRIYPIADERPGVITLVDLTDNSRRARSFFSGGRTSACELCGGVGARGCGGTGQGGSAGGCIAAARQQSSAPEDDKPKPVKSTSSSLSNNLISLLPISLILSVKCLILK
ncbi:CD109 antigen-like isoform X2 [Arctopsyche grandis]|uniref:CD109 antigen-like isoform X2 n=1 Tax=Arctopsyche grandis TaxID=121162 RepID=UPI00406D9BF4